MTVFDDEVEHGTAAIRPGVEADRCLGGVDLDDLRDHGYQGQGAAGADRQGLARTAAPNLSTYPSSGQC